MFFCVRSVSLFLLFPVVANYYEGYTLYKTQQAQSMKSLLECIYTHTFSPLIPLTHSQYTHVRRVLTFIHGTSHSVLCLLLEHSVLRTVCFFSGEEGTSDAEASDCCCCFCNGIDENKPQMQLPNFQEQDWKIYKSELNSLFFYKIWKFTIIGKH